MKVYLNLFKLKFMNQLQYRMAAIAGISTQFFFGIVYIMGEAHIEGIRDGDGAIEIVFEGWEVISLV